MKVKGFLEAIDFYLYCGIYIDLMEDGKDCATLGGSNMNIGSSVTAELVFEGNVSWLVVSDGKTTMDLTHEDAELLYDKLAYALNFWKVLDEKGKNDAV